MRGMNAMTHKTDFAALAVGDKLPPHVQGPINRATLALFAGASNDYVPLHIDSDFAKAAGMPDVRSEEHTSELQSLMRSSYAVFCLKKKNNNIKQYIYNSY